MSGHQRVCIAAFLSFAGFWVSPASSNSLTEWLNNPATEETKAPVSAECVSHPGKSAALGQHWVYYRDGHRKCWFETQSTVIVQKHVHHRSAKQPIITREENDAARRKRKVLNAQDRMVGTTPADAPRPSGMGSHVVDAAAPMDGGTLVFAASVPAEHVTDRPTTGSGPRLTDMLSAVASLDKDGPSSSAPQPGAGLPSIPGDDKDHWQLEAIRLGRAAIAIGLVLLIGSLLFSHWLRSGAAIRRT